MPAYKNFPLNECDRTLQKIMREAPPGTAFFQKWTCGGCGERVTGNEPNKLFIEGRHEERADGSPCGYVTDIRKTGCNYAMHMAIGGVADMPPKGSA